MRFLDFRIHIPAWVVSRLWPRLRLCWVSLRESGFNVNLYGAKQGQELKSWPECQRRIASVCATHLARPLALVEAADLQTTADSWDPAQPAAAAVRYLRPVLKWAVQRQYCPSEIASIVSPATVKRKSGC